jgi:D-ribulokinase
LGLSVHRALFGLLEELPVDVVSRVAALAFDGTSATSMLIDRATGDSLTAPKLYNESQGAAALSAVQVLGFWV